MWQGAARSSCADAAAKRFPVAVPSFAKPSLPKACDMGVGTVAGVTLSDLGFLFQKTILNYTHSMQPGVNMKVKVIPKYAKQLS